VGMQPGRGLGASTSTSPCCRKPSQPRPLIHTHQSNPGSRSSREQTNWARLGYAVICRATTPPTYHHRRSPPHRVTKVKVDIGGVHSGSDTHFPATHARFFAIPYQWRAPSYPHGTCRQRVCALLRTSPAQCRRAVCAAGCQARFRGLLNPAAITGHARVMASQTKPMTRHRPRPASARNSPECVRRWV